jgi:hypothetical protein
MYAQSTPIESPGTVVISLLRLFLHKGIRSSPMCPTLLYASKRFRFVCAYGAILPTIIENTLNIVYVPLKEVFQIACQ